MDTRHDERAADAGPRSSTDDHDVPHDQAADPIPLKACANCIRLRGVDGSCRIGPMVGDRLAHGTPAWVRRAG